MRAAVLLIAFNAACHRTHASPTDRATSSPSSPNPATGDAPTGTATADSVRGILSMVGNEPLAVLVLTPGDGALPTVVLTGPSREALHTVVGLELTVFGKRTGARSMAASPRGTAVFEVQRFAVRSANGTPAQDGVLLATNNGFALRLADGRTMTVLALPTSLRRMVGARVWLAGPLNRSPESYGVIREPQ